MPDKREALADPMSIRLNVEDYRAIEIMSERSGEAMSTHVRSLVSLGLATQRRRPYGKVGESSGVRERRLDGKPPVSKSGIAGSSPAAPAKPKEGKSGDSGKSSSLTGKTGPKGRAYNPVTDNPYIITHVAKTEEQEL